VLHCPLMSSLQLVTALVTISLSFFFYKKIKHRVVAPDNLRVENGGAVPPALTAAPRSGGLLSGVKVVELATVVAVPSCTRLLAEAGASVVKVEVGKRAGGVGADARRDGSGDPWRKFFLQYEVDKSRVFGSCFDAANAGKVSVQLDLAHPDDLATLHALLADAHVFASNVRVAGLSKLGLDPATLAARHPHLIIAHLSAFGTAGVAAAAPGYDIAAFWSCSGLAAAISVAPDRYSTYPAAFGDCTTGMALASAIVLALPRQARTGLGVVLDSSLLAAGCWANAEQLLHADEQARASAPGGHKAFADLHEFPPPAYATAKVSAALTDEQVSRLGAQTADGRYVSVRHGVRAATVRSSLHLQDDATLADAAAAIGAATASSLPDGVFATVTYMPDLLEEDVTQRPGFVAHPDIPDLPALCASPVTMAVGPFAEPTAAKEEDATAATGTKRRHRLARLARAPRLDEGGGWLRSHRRFPPTPPSAADGIANLASTVVACADDDDALARGVVLQATRRCVGAVSLGCRQLADFGLTVRVLDIGKGVPADEAGPTLRRHAGRGKADAGVVDDLSPAGLASALQLAASDAAATGQPVIVVTDDEDVAAAARTASLTLLFLDVGPVSEEHSFFHASGMSTAIAGRNAPLLPALPTGFASSIVSVSVCLAAGQLLLALHRVPAKAHEATVSTLALGTYVQGFIPLPIGLAEPSKIRVVMPPGSLAPMRFPVPTSNTFRTADGFRIMLLGVELPRHLGRTMRALGLVPTGYLGLAWTVLTKVLFADGASKLEKCVPIFEYLNSSFAASIGRMTLADFRQVAARHDLWYMPVVTANEVVHWSQAEVEDIFLDKGGAVRSIVRIGTLY